VAIQFNLLPDVKLEFDRQQRTKRLVYIVTFLATSLAVALFVISFVFVNVLQKTLLDNAGKDIQKYSKQLNDIPNLDKILSIQNQLNALPTLHQNKHYASRLFDYLPQITPVKIHVGKLNLDMATNTLIIAGTTDKIETVNQYVDTIKFTTFQVPDISDEAECKAVKGTWDASQQICTKLAFTNVVLTQIGRSDKETSYIITFIFDPALFTGTRGVKLIVPDKITTRSVINAPDANGELFNGQTGKPEAENKTE